MKEYVTTIAKAAVVSSTACFTFSYFPIFGLNTEICKTLYGSKNKKRFGKFTFLIVSETGCSKSSFLVWNNMVLSVMKYDTLSNMVLYVTNSVIFYLTYVYIFLKSTFSFSLKPNFKFKCSVVCSFLLHFPSLCNIDHFLCFSGPTHCKCLPLR